ncbi:DUF4129 domain-containing protein [Streptomyces genisteinicus]|uniref:DUF4129 domain-containing protein n=1 Tax=Streptomyces genisteinicus TaxID=2768068 RepID=A0A7H0HSS1_9ACTN|nr:DUF4129 domain-containing protein [Streptomyces genisteinicus]QNP63587.1 DUF4129 domain-containing protein [Streptomyces genisteinicus]
MSGAGGGTTADLSFPARDDIPVDISRVPAREAAERELSDPVYGENEPNLLQRALDDFLDWVGGVFDGWSGSGPGGTVGLMVVLLLAAALIGGLWWRLGTPRRSASTADSLFSDGPRSAAEHRSRAESHAAAGRWNEAVQERMRAIVRALEERALLTPRPGRTADEAAADAGRSLPSHAGELRAAARSFDDVTYGGRTGDQDMYERIRRLDAAVESAEPLLADTSGGAS